MLKSLVTVQVWLASKKKKEKGQSLAEYGLILGLIAVVCIAALTTMGGQLQDILNQITDALSTAQDSMNPGG